jgi:ATP-binding cassette subfamily B protein/subfamily B ATP-binding cassette protein MsbA
VSPNERKSGSRSSWRLLSYALADWKGWAFILAGTLLSSAVSLLQPWPMKFLIDHILGDVPMAEPVAWGVQTLPGGDTPRGLIAWVALAGVVFFACHSVLDVLLTRSWVRVGQGMVYRVAGDLFAHAQRRSLLFHSQNSVGDLLSRITGDSWCVYKVLDTFLLLPLFAGITILGMLVVMFQMDVTLTLLALAVAPLMVGTTVVLGRPLRLAARARREIESRLQAHVQQTLMGMPVVQAFAQEDREHHCFQELTRDSIRVQGRTALLGSLSGLGSGLAVTLGTGAVLWLGAHHVLQGRLNLGALLVFLAYLGTLQGQLQAITGMYGHLQEIGASTDRVLEILGEGPEVKDRPDALPLPSVEGALCLEDVTFGYEAGRPVLQNVSLEVQPGQTVALVGATGAGKTTLASLLPRFFDPWEGRVLIDGRDVRQLRLKDLRAQVGLVLQEPFLFPMSIAENIAFGRPDATREQIESAARAAHLHEFIQGLPEKYDTPVGQRGLTLSGGERQRLAIARALLKDAPILILDEPTSALDAQTEWLFLQALARLMRGRTTLIIAHRLSTIRNADQIVVLQEGRVVEQGTHPELLARAGLYAHLYRVQRGGVRQVAVRLGEAS